MVSFSFISKKIPDDKNQVEKRAENYSHVMSKPRKSKENSPENKVFVILRRSPLKKK